MDEIDRRLILMILIRPCGCMYSGTITRGETGIEELKGEEGDGWRGGAGSILLRILRKHAIYDIFFSFFSPAVVSSLSRVPRF